MNTGIEDWNVTTRPIVAVAVTAEGNPHPLGYVIEIGGDYYTIVSKPQCPLRLHPYAADSLLEAVYGTLKGQVKEG